MGNNQVPEWSRRHSVLLSRDPLAGNISRGPLWGNNPQSSVLFDIRSMVEEDIPEVVPIERACFGERWTASIFYSELANPNASYFVATLSGPVIGFIGYWLILEEAHITTLAVPPPYRRQHIAERMLLHVIDHCRGAGCKWITLEVRKSNIAAQRLYEKYGFRSLGHRRRYYQDNNEDALVMWTENIWHEPFNGRFQELRQKIEATPIGV